MRVSNNLMKVLLVVYIWATSDTVSIHKTPYIQKKRRIQMRYQVKQYPE